MKNEYQILRATLKRLDEVRETHNRKSSLNLGVIYGGLDMSETGNEIIKLHNKALEIMKREIARGCRLSYLKVVIEPFGGSTAIDSMIRYAEDSSEFDRERRYRK